MIIVKLAVLILSMLLCFCAGILVGQNESDPIWRDYLEDLHDKLTLRCEDLEDHGKLTEMNALMYAVDLIEEELYGPETTAEM